MPEALYFTDSDEANRLIAKEPLALLIACLQPATT